MGWIPPLPTQGSWCGFWLRTMVINSTAETSPLETKLPLINELHYCEEHREAWVLSATALRGAEVWEQNDTTRDATSSQPGVEIGEGSSSTQSPGLGAVSEVLKKQETPLLAKMSKGKKEGSRCLLSPRYSKSFH